MSSSKTVFAKWLTGPWTKDSSLCPSPHSLLSFCPHDTSSCQGNWQLLLALCSTGCGRACHDTDRCHTSCLLPGLHCLRNLYHWHSLLGEGGQWQTKCQDWRSVAKDTKACPWVLQKPSKLLSTWTYSYYSIAQNIIKVPALRKCSCKLRAVQ